MECPGKVDPSTLIAQYINLCYNDSLFCDLIVICAENRTVSCHKLVMCSLSKKLLSICTDEDQSGNLTYIHLPDFSHMEVKDTLDVIYSNIGKKKVEIVQNEVLSVFGIESTSPKPQFMSPSRNAEVKQETTSCAKQNESEGLSLIDFIKPEVDSVLMEEEEWVDNCRTSSFSQQLESLNITKYHEYIATRREFWEEHFVKVILKASKFIEVGIPE